MDLLVLAAGGLGGTTDLIEGWTSLIWTERFINAGEFSFKTPRIEYTADLIQEGSAVSLLDSRQVMLVESMEIKRTNGISELEVKGRSYETFMENRIIAGLRGKTWKLPQSYIPKHAVASLIWDAFALCYQDTGLYGTNPIVSDIFDVAQANYVLGTTLTDSTGLMYSAVGQEWWVEPGYMYNKLLEWMKIANVGVRALRGPSTGQRLTFDSSGVPTLASAALIDELRLDIYSESSDVIDVFFSDTAGHLVDPTYLFANKGYSNVAYMLSSTTAYDDQYSYIDGTSPSTGIGSYRRELLVDPGFDQGSMTGTDYAAALQAKGQEALALVRPTRAIDAKVANGAPYTYNDDYKLGDIVWLKGKYGFDELMRVVEYVRSQDINGETSYPTLSRVES